jgi:dimethylamine/trimethylamine dehydrogenase
MAEAVHKHGSLAGIELVYNGYDAPNLYSRVPSLAPSSMGTIGGSGYDPVQTRRMDKEDIRNLRKWHREAALRARRAGFDIIYCYAAHAMSAAIQFILKRYNDRTDEYGGSLENRVRLFRELIEDTKDAVGDTCAVAVRFAVDELLGEDGITNQGEGYDVVAMLAELPDLWDVNISNWSNDSLTSRFGGEGHQEKYISFVKGLTTKPVVGVGRYTSPDSMGSAIQRGVMDMIGAARPSIADPFLPKKIEEGRLDDIRECIGCNICVTGDHSMTPIRCTQNPSMGEEWRRGWHPELIRPSHASASILVIGAGPAGLEAGRALGQRGYKVTISDAASEAGGRVARECRLPGLSAWGRVRDWRLLQIGKMPNVDLYLESKLTAADALEFGADAIAVATGATWRRDGVGRYHNHPVAIAAHADVLTPDDVMAGKRPAGPNVTIFDDDHYYLGGVLAELLVKEGHTVTLVTPASLASYYTRASLEQAAIQSRLLNLGITMRANEAVKRIAKGSAAVACVFTQKETGIEADCVVLVTSRISTDALYQELSGRHPNVMAIGDARAPATIAHAVHAGRRYAEEFGAPLRDALEVPFRRELVSLAPA